MPQNSRSTPKGLRAKTLLTKALETSFFQGEDPAIPHLLVPTKSRATLVLGENASGKSFLRKIVQGLCQRYKMECMPLSMEGRASSVPWSSLIYGAESFKSTGENSAYTVRKAIQTARGRTNPHVIYFDEPDIGLSESWAAGLGQMLAEFFQDLPEHTRAVYVVTHSRPLVEQLVPAKPNYLHLGIPAQKAPQSLQEWLSRPITPRDPSQLGEESHQLFKKIQALLKR